MGGSGASRSGVSWTDVLCTGSRAEDNRLVGLTALVVIQVPNPHPYYSKRCPALRTLLNPPSVGFKFVRMMYGVGA